jgi:hypothetical protein
VEWFVAHQSGEPHLAASLAHQFEQGWDLMARLLHEGLPSAEVVKRLKSAGYSSLLIESGTHEYQLPGRTASFLVLEKDHQITLEKWRSIADSTTNAVLIGMGKRDVSNDHGHGSEKQIHLAAFELPKRGDYLEITTQSLSPLGKVVVVFVGIALLVTSDEKLPEKPAPAPPPPPPPPPVTINRKGTSDHPYTAAGGRPFPLGPRGPVRIAIPPSESLPQGANGYYTCWAYEVCFPSGPSACPNHVRQTIRDTVTFGNGGSERHPEPQGGDPGGHESTARWAFDPPPNGVNPATQSNADGTSSYIDAPGLIISDRSQLPATKRTTYRWELLDCHGNVLDCQQSEYVLQIDANGVVTNNDLSPPIKCK